MKSNDTSKRMMKSKMAWFGDTIVSLADALDITRQTCAKKLETVEGWTNVEIAKIAQRYDLNDEEIITIFDLRRFNFKPKSGVRDLNGGE